MFKDWLINSIVIELFGRDIKNKYIPNFPQLLMQLSPKPISIFFLPSCPHVSKMRIQFIYHLAIFLEQIGWIGANFCPLIWIIEIIVSDHIVHFDAFWWIEKI